MEIGLSTWSLHRHMGSLRQCVFTDTGEKYEWMMDYPEDVSLLKFAGFAKDKYGITQLELTQPLIQSTESSYLAQLRDTVTAEGSTVQNVPIDVGNICEPDEKVRAEHLGEIKRWMDAACALGSRAVRVNTGPPREGFDSIGCAIESYKQLVTYAEKLGLLVLIENHGGLSSDPDMIVRIVESVSSERFGACPDFGNFQDAILYKALEKLMPFAKLVHAKSYNFDGAGEETRLDYRRCLEIVKRSGFDGVLSIEYEGEGDQCQGIAKTKELITRYL